MARRVPEKVMLADSKSSEVISLIEAKGTRHVLF
jgi:hypothetical protein